jgi:DNA-binding LacI/PurR family transcriptional regulator
MASMAAHLGVSTATIAKALHGQGRISPVMVEKIRTLAREWNYTPNQAARQLRTSRSDTVGLLITSDIDNPWYGSFISHLENILAAHHLSLSLAIGKYDSVKSRHAIEHIFQGRVCGIIVGPVLNQAHLDQLCSGCLIRVPIVTFGNIQHLASHFVALDQARGAQLVLEHLFALGHSHIAYVGGCSLTEAAPGDGTRAGSYLEFVESHGLTPDSVLLPPASYLRHYAFDAIQQLLASRPAAKLPTAFFCHNDDSAIGVLLALQQRGYKIPEDFSVTGFDDIEESSFTMPVI